MRHDINKLIDHWCTGFDKGHVKMSEIVDGIQTLLPPNASRYATLAVYKHLMGYDSACANHFFDDMSKPILTALKRQSNIYGHINDHRQMAQQLNQEIGSYYYWDSRCFKAICKHIEKADDCVIIERLPHKLKFTNSHGPVSYKDSRSWGIPGYDAGATEFELTIAVQYVDENDDDAYYDKEISKKYTILVPIELEDNCTEEEFNKRFKKFLVNAKKKRDQVRQEIILPEVKAIVERHPEMAQKVLAGLKKKE